MTESADVGRGSLAERYETRQLLRRGPRGETVLARDRTSSALVVVKTAVGEAPPEISAALADEVGRIRRLGGFYAGAVSAGHEAGVTWVVSPFVAGMPLQERLAGGPLPTGEALAVAGHVLRALDAAHAAGVLHGHVTPANVMISGGGTIDEAVLVDFLVAPGSHLAAIFGVFDGAAARYLAPEQAGLIDRPSDERADLYSTGIVLFQCLAGRPPFDAGTMGELLRQQLSAPPPRLRSLGLDVPPVLDEIVQRLLRKDPDDRYQSAAAALADVDRLAGALARHEAAPRLTVGAEDRRRTLTEPSFTGREAELAVLDLHLDDARHGSGRFVLVDAESGGGKSRLLEEFQARAEGAGAWILRGECFHQAAPRPLQLLAGVAAGVLSATRESPTLAATLADRIAEHRAALCEVFPELHETLGVAAPVAGLPEGQGLARGFDAVVRLLDALGTIGRPTVIILDDFHWADELSLEVLTAWTRRTGDDGANRNLLIIAAAVQELLGDDHRLRGVPGVPHLQLPSLPATDVRRMVESMAGPIPDEALGVIVRLSEGNPFMVTAVLRGLSESGAVTPTAAGWQFHADRAGLQTSRQAAELLGRRLELLDPPTRRLLSTGAALGRDFDLHLAAVLAGQSPSEARAAVTQALERHFVWFSEAERVAFVHSRLRAAFLDTLEAGELAGLHLRAAEEIQAADPSAAFELAYHFDAAGEAGRALHHALSSGAVARARHDLELAERQYRIAERGLVGADASLRQKVAETLGQIFMLRGRYDEADERLELARSLAHDDLSAARIDGQLGELAYRRGEVERAATLLEKALTTLGEPVPHQPLAVGMHLGREALRRGRRLIGHPARVDVESPGDPDRRQLMAHLRNRLFYSWVSGNRGNAACWWLTLRQLNVLEGGPETRELAHAYAILGAGMTVMWPPAWRLGLRYTDRAARIHERLGDLWGKGQALNMRGLVLHATGQFAEGAEACGQAQALLERPGDAWERNAAAWNRALCLYRLGDLRAAVDEAHRAHQGAVAIGDAEAEAMGLLAWSKASGGRVPAEPVETARGWSGGDLQGEVALLQAQALHWRAHGRPATAIARLERADQLVRRSRAMDVYLVSPLAWLATVYREAAEQAPPLLARQRRRLLRRARTTAGRAVRYGRIYRNELPHALRERAMVAALEGRTGRARRLFDRSAEVAERQGAKAEYAETLRLRGKVGLQLSWPGAADDIARAESDLPVAAPEVPGAESLGIAERFSALLEAGRRLTSASSSEEIAAAVRDAAITLLRAEHCQVVGVEAVSDADPQVGATRSTLRAPILADVEPAAYFVASHGKVAGLFGEQEDRLAEFIGNLAGAALERERLGQEMRARVVGAQEAERARVARDLHDEIGQSITSVLLGLRLVETSLSAPSPDVVTLLDRLGKVRQVASDALGEVQRLAFELRPTVLDDLGLVPALRRLVDDISSRYGVTVELDAEGPDGFGRVAPEVETTVYRVVQEALTNLGRHANASTCSVVVVRTAGQLRAVVEDDGAGFDPGSTPERGLGLRGMAERAALVGGNIRITSSPGNGTLVVLEVPVV